MAQAAVLPVLFAVDRDPNSLEAMLSDLSGRFGKDFTVTGDTSREAALAAVQEMAAAEEPVALLLVDDAASDFLARAHELHPRAKRVLLIDRDYSSTSPAPQAMTLGRADYYIVRPWTDDEIMYGAITEYLSSWETEQQKPNFELFRIVAEDGDNRVLQLRDALTRFRMPFGIYATESEAGRRLLDEAGLDAMRLPVVIRYDGQVTIDPSLPDLARAIGVSVKNDVDSCEVAIVGAGPAGLTAAVYAASEGLDTVMLDRALSGGQAGTSPMIRNYPGFPHGINGGEGNSAGQAALHVAKFARTVTLLVRSDSFAKSMSSYLVRAIESTPNVAVRHRTEVVDASGDETLESLKLADRTHDTLEEVSAAALFIMIGGEPHTQWLPDGLARDAQGYLITGRDLLEQPGEHWDYDREPLTLETSVPGVFAAGDVRQGSIKRVAAAVGEGGTVGRLVHEHLRSGDGATSARPALT